MEPETTTTEPAPGNGAASPPMPKGFPPIAIRPPDPRRATDSVIGVEIAAPIASDGSLPLRCAADAVETARATWSSACTLHVQEMGKVNALNTEASPQLRSRAWFYRAKQQTLRQCDAALGEIRKETKELEARIARQTVPPISREDAGADGTFDETPNIAAILQSVDPARQLAETLAKEPELLPHSVTPDWQRR